ncbi:MAG: formylglycine-generating enzyme family protein [Bacteroidales bacterium]|nr:formylglycine-generating enzyme family protein [Bacteroidales bacterium]
MMKIFFYILLSIALIISQTTHSQKNGLWAQQILADHEEEILLSNDLPLFSIDINNETHHSGFTKTLTSGKHIQYGFPSGLKAGIEQQNDFKGYKKFIIRFSNQSEDTLDISNVVSFGISKEHIYITANGPWSLARTKLFRPGKTPVGVILPDNAWEMGYASVETGTERSLCAIARRTNYEKAKRYRYKTLLYPGGFVEYTLFFEFFEGEWQNGLKKMFQENYLYDLEAFDESLYKRDDLAWIKDEYLMVLQFAWDHKFFDWETNQYNFETFLQEAEKLMGGYDVFGIWTTWPALGMDRRNQWDLYADLPGGLDKLRELSKYAQENDTKFFIAYNPWDKSTRTENPYKGMARLIEATDANGVVLDTRGSSSYELQRAADSIKEGVVMYSEGMAVPKDMPGIISGRVHDAIFMPPPLNLNKLIRPDFAIFRVCQLSQGRIHREACISFFNGYGNELNTFAAGRPDWMEEEYKFLGKISMMLRENSKACHSFEWTPIIQSTHDSIWVNKWPADNKTVFTVFSLIPEGFDGPLFEAEPDHHYVSLYHHEELIPDTIKGKLFIPAKTSAFDQAWLNTRREGNVDCIAAFRELLDVELSFDTLKINARTGDLIKVWAGAPSYQNEAVILETSAHHLKLHEHFGRYEGKFVVQLFEGSEIIDERIVYIDPGTPRLISRVETTESAGQIPEGMVFIEGSEYLFSVKSGNGFIPYPDYNEPRKVKVRSFYMDKHPVSNLEYYEFVAKSGYRPEDSTNYLKHWRDGKYPEGMGVYPVVNLGLKDARAFAAWSGKRLPTEIEWQYAAQGGTHGQAWPWRKGFDSTKCNNALGYITAIDSFPSGVSPFGVLDMVGNVWQMTHDVYDNGSYYFNILKGGSYYKPTSSWWYVQGGPKAVNENQMLLLVSPSFNRNATVGFRLVKDAD